MVRVKIDFNTESLNIPRLLHNNKGTFRDASLSQQVIQLSVIANISTENCVSFPNYITVGGPRGIGPCYYSQQQNNLTLSAENPQLEFNFKYGFILTAFTREEVSWFINSFNFVLNLIINIFTSLHRSHTFQNYLN